MASITDNQGTEQKTILPTVRSLRLYRWMAMVLALVAAVVCVVLMLQTDAWSGAVLAAVALGLAANVGLALVTLVPDARNAQARLLSEMMGQSGEGQMVTGRDGRMMYMNKAAQGFFGVAGPNIDLNQLAGSNNAVAKTLRRLHADALSGASGQDEFRLTLPNGETHGLELRVHPIGNPADKVACI